jgi:hypothetical protein
MLGTRNYPVVIGGGIAVLLFSLVGAAAITGVLPSASERKGSLPEKVAKPTACRNCGVVADVRAPVSKHSPYRVVLRMDDGSERIVAQLDLKADRANGVLRVMAAHAEPGADRAEAAAAARAELSAVARWQGMTDIDVSGRGNLVQALTRSA